MITGKFEKRNQLRSEEDMVDLQIIESIENDIIRLIRFYNENGFRNINIDLKTEFNVTNNKFNLYFYIVEGQRFKFNEIKLNGIRAR